MKTGAHRPFGAAVNVLGTLGNAVLAEQRAPVGARRVSSIDGFGENHRVKHVEPSRGGLVGGEGVADHRHDQHLAGASGGNVRDAHRFLLVVPQHVVPLLEQLDRRTAGERHGPQSAGWIDVPRRLPRGLGSRGIDQDHHRELEPFGLVNRHDAHAVGPLLDDRRLGRSTSLGLLLEPHHERSK
jgi:hypothetical protein